MNDVIIIVENLGKKYLLRHQRQERYTALRDVISEKASGLFRRRGGNGKSDPTREEFWALKDVSFEVKQGEVVGIIGRNGAGKSTLLKILSRITDPTEGRVRLRGRVASLLEVGTGFHPELTGRENIFLNGAILGMKRREIKAKFDEIVAFAEIEKFLDTPVKRYSSGMYVRLAFAVAAHLEPEILIIDEVLAVGDAEFQKKCLGKMSDVATKEGRTVIFVSHQLHTIEALCSRAILLEKGRITYSGEPSGAIQNYISTTKSFEAIGRSGQFITRVAILSHSGDATNYLRVGDPATILIDLDLGESSISAPALGIGFDSSFGQRIFTVGSFFDTSPLPPLCGRVSISCHIPTVPLTPGQYTLKVALSLGLHQPIEALQTAAWVEIVASDFFGSGLLPAAGQGLIVVRSRWQVVENLQ